MFSRKPLNHLFVFVHLPKCAGTSLLKTFAQIGRQRFGVVAEHDLKSQALGSLEEQMETHRIEPNKLDLIMGRDCYFGIQAVSPRSPFFFTFIRQPVERYISQYRYYVDCAANPEHRAHNMAVERLAFEGRQLTLREFAEQNKGSNFLCKVLGSIAPSRQAWDHFWNVDGGEAFNAAVEMLEAMSFIGFVEQIETDTKSICDRLDVKPIVRKVNQSFAEVKVDSKTRQLIEQNNVYDLKLFEVAKKLRKEMNC
ncbi:sulfotransferase family protein [bacterium]|nr:sulfotransferase family protein [bacterium]